MGGAIARGLVSHNFEGVITISSPNNHGELDELRKFSNTIHTTIDNKQCVSNADMIIVAVKPWLLQTVLDEISATADFSRQTLISIVAGVKCDEIVQMVRSNSQTPEIVRLIPNTAIAVGESMTFISSLNVQQEKLQSVKSIFDMLGKTAVVEERLMEAGTALASCGIAYALRYIRAAVEGGVELGFYPDTAKGIVMQTLIGAVKVLEASGANPESEIDKVTTPGGITIKGLNAMERNGFSAAIIEGLKASYK